MNLSAAANDRRAASATGGRVVIDCTHMQRRLSGIERITQSLFTAEALAPLDVATITSSPGRLSIVARQMLQIPAAALREPNSVWVFPGYPPSPLFVRLRKRAVLYVHDMFLVTRPQDLNRAARLYTSRLFRMAVRGMRYFLVNSAATAAELAPHVAADAEVLPYRPKVNDIFSLAGRAGPRTRSGAALRVGVLGTVEPRKNLLDGARICEALARKLGRPVEFHVIGRAGWGEDAKRLAELPHVRMHGFLDTSEATAIIETFDLFLSTSHDEGLGLPLLEVQYAGLPVFAPDRPVFREVLGESGRYIETRDPAGSAEMIATLLSAPDWRDASAGAARANLERWNRTVERDRKAVVELLRRLSAVQAH